MLAETSKLASDYPTLVRRFSIGKSWEGCDILALKISDDVAVDEDEPEVLFDAGRHAREHLTVEMAMYLLNELAGKYASNARVRSAVDSREIWVVPNVNPDGSEYDLLPHGYRDWRKNVQPNRGSTWFGTDLNRNWGYRWGCCGGSSVDPSADSYHGASPFSAPETQAVRDVVLSRRVGGVQQIKTSIDFHTFGELVMWPFAHTTDDTAPGMTLDQRDAFAALGTSMALSNGFTPQQTSDLYISDGNLRDWQPRGVTAAHRGCRLPVPAERPAGYVLRRPARRQRPAAPAPPGPGGGNAPPAPPPPPPPPTGDDDGTGGPSAATGVLDSRAGLDAGGHVRLRVRCATVEQTHCRGTIRLRTRLPGGRRIVTIA